ncbi:MAG: hypothetical protein ACXWQ5_08280 [Ktedonobacterales bacterium]
MHEHQRIQQQRHTTRAPEQDLGGKSGVYRWSDESQRSGRSILLPALAWGLIFVVGLIPLLGIGQVQLANAAGGNGGSKRESEGTLGSKHGQKRQAGCILTVPANPLTAAGLATPYQLSGKTADGMPCHEGSTDVASFVQGAVLDPATGQVSIYNPLVIDQGAKPAVAPVVPTLPANAVVGIWFGSNATSLRLQGAGVRTGQCVDGLGGSNFGQVAYCNATAFFKQANTLIQAKKLTPPAIGMGADGLACPTVRDFAVVDQDQSDNVTSSYLLTDNGMIAQNTAANAAKLAGATPFANGSDNRLVAVALDKALNCTPWTAPDLADPGHMVTALPLNELQAAMSQAAPVALVPANDPMTLVNGQPSLTKQNLYRAGVDQQPEPSTAQATADARMYCQNVMQIAPQRIQTDKPFTVNAASLDPAVADSLFTFLATRLSFTVDTDGLNCTGLLKQANPVHLTMNNGVVVGATFTAPAAQGKAVTPAANVGARIG